MSATGCEFRFSLKEHGPLCGQWRLLSHGMNDAVSADKPLILIAYAHTLEREGLKMLVSRVVGDVQFLDAHDGASLIDAAAHPALRLALVDLEMAGMRGGARLVELARLRPGLPLVVVSTITSADELQHICGLRSLHAFVSKSSGIASMRVAIEAAMNSRRLPIVLTGRTQSRALRELTPRQEQIRNLLRQGMSNKMIASALGISAGTVKNHITEIFRVLNATNRTQAAQWRVEPGD